MQKKDLKPVQSIPDKLLKDKLESAQKKANQKATKLARLLRERKNRELIMKFFEGELIKTTQKERAIPSDLVRCSLFSVRNQNTKRETYDVDKPLTLDVIGGGKIKFIGQELRQDDETVWIQLVHLAKETKSETVIFRPTHFLKSINWPVNGPSYKRLLRTIQRLTSASIDLYLDKIDCGMSVKLVARYNYCKEEDAYWYVDVFDREDTFLSLYDKLYAKFDIDMRLSVSQGVASWLYMFLCSHDNPRISIDKLATGAGIKLEDEGDNQLPYGKRLSKYKKRLTEAKRVITRALEELKEKEFLSHYEIDNVKNVISIKKAARLRKPRITIK